MRRQWRRTAPGLLLVFAVLLLAPCPGDALEAAGGGARALRQVQDAGGGAGALGLLGRGWLAPPASPPRPRPSASPSPPPAAPAASPAAADPCVDPDTGATFLTARSRCPNDQFNVAVAEPNASWTWAAEQRPGGGQAQAFRDVLFTGGWATTRGAEAQQLRPFDASQLVAAVRVADGAWVVPKGFVGGGGGGGSGPMPLTGRQQRGCVLRGAGASAAERPYPRFRLVTSPQPAPGGGGGGGVRVLANSVAAPGVPIFKGAGGVPCARLQEQVVGVGGRSDAARGEDAVFYGVLGCVVELDDCSR